MASVASLFTPANPVDVVDLSGNALTQVPPNLPQLFPQVTSLSLANNQITSIGSGQLNLSATVKSLDVSSNNISSIAVSALPGLCQLILSFIRILNFDLIILFVQFAVNYANGSTINLSSNKLTALDQDVFQPIIQSFAAGSFNPTATFVNASLSEILIEFVPFLLLR